MKAKELKSLFSSVSTRTYLTMGEHIFSHIPKEHGLTAMFFRLTAMFFRLTAIFFRLTAMFFRTNECQFVWLFMFWPWHVGLLANNMVLFFRKWKPMNVGSKPMSVGSKPMSVGLLTKQSRSFEMTILTNWITKNLTAVSTQHLMHLIDKLPQWYLGDVLQLRVSRNSLCCLVS